MTRRDFTRLPHRGKHGTRSGAFELLRRVHRDSRYRNAPAGAAKALDVALTEWADADGVWWVKQETWAAAVGISDRTLRRAITELCKCTLVYVQPYRRPDGFEGASIYSLDPVLTRADNSDHPCSQGEQVDESGRRTSLDRTGRPSSADNGDHPERVSNGFQNEPPNPPAGGPSIGRKELRRYTGCRAVRGTHAGGHIYDPLGIDNQPLNWPYDRPSAGEIAEALSRARNPAPTSEQELA